MRLIAGLCVAAIALVALWLWSSGLANELSWWAAQKQREFQNAIATTVRAIRGGDASATFGLIAACAAYGLVHAIGPGHGKVLIAGAAVASRETMKRMAVLALISSLAQSLTAIILVYGGFALFAMSSSWAVDTADLVLAPLSYAIIGIVGAILLYRGLRALAAWQRPKDHAHHLHEHEHDHTCGHAHAPGPEQVERAKSLRDAVALVAAIAIRPCTGAILVLVISWGLDLVLVGALGVLAMGLGTAAFTILVAIGGVSLRGATLLAADGNAGLKLAFPAMQILAGGLVMIAGFSLALPSLF